MDRVMVLAVTGVYLGGGDEVEGVEFVGRGEGGEGVVCYGRLVDGWVCLSGGC